MTLCGWLASDRECACQDQKEIFQLVTLVICVPSLRRGGTGTSAFVFAVFAVTAARVNCAGALAEGCMGADVWV